MISMATWQAITPVLLAMALYVVVLIVGLYLVEPVRSRLIDEAEEMLNDDHWTDDQRRDVIMLVDRRASFAVGLLLPLAVLSVALDIVLGRLGEIPAEDTLLNDARYHSLLDKFVLSICAANPIAAFVTVALTIALAPFLILGMAKISYTREMVDRPAYRAVSSFARGRQLA